MTSFTMKMMEHTVTMMEVEEQRATSLTLNVQVLEAKEPQAMIGVEGEDARVDSRMIKDERVKGEDERGMFSQAKNDQADKLDNRKAFQAQVG
jgi:hypothetical protein